MSAIYMYIYINISSDQHSMPHTYTHIEREMLQLRALTHLNYIQSFHMARSILVLVAFRPVWGLLKMRIRTQMRGRSFGGKLLLLLLLLMMLMMRRRLWWRWWWWWWWWWLRLWHFTRMMTRRRHCRKDWSPITTRQPRIHGCCCCRCWLSLSLL